MTAFEASWSPTHTENPVVIVTGYDAIDDIIDTLLQSGAGWINPRNAAIFTIHASVHRPLAFSATRSFRFGDWASDRRRRPNNTPQPRIVVGINAIDKVGSLKLTATGTWYAQGDSRGDGEGVWYRHHAGDHHFPADSQISIDEIRIAVKHFLLNSGCRRPPGLIWREWPRTSRLAGRN